MIKLNISSLPIRTLTHIHQHPRPLPVEALMATGSAGMLDERLERLLDGGQISRSEIASIPGPVSSRASGACSRNWGGSSLLLVPR